MPAVSENPLKLTVTRCSNILLTPGHYLAPPSFPISPDLRDPPTPLNTNFLSFFTAKSHARNQACTTNYKILTSYLAVLVTLILFDTSVRGTVRYQLRFPNFVVVTQNIKSTDLFTSNRTCSISNQLFNSPSFVYLY